MGVHLNDILGYQYPVAIFTADQKKQFVKLKFWMI
jgi:hypothetical protein